MIVLTVLMILGLWIGVSVFRDWKKLREYPQMLFRLCSLVLLAALLVESLLLYGDDALTAFPDGLTLSLMLLLSAPLTCETPAKGTVRILVSSALAVVALLLPLLMHGRCEALHLLVLLVAASYLLTVSVISLVRWMHSQDVMRPVAPVSLAEIRIRNSEVLLLLVIAGGTALISSCDGYSSLLWLPGILGALFFCILYLWSGSDSALSPIGWMRHLAAVPSDGKAPRNPLDAEFYDAVYRKCCQYMESKKPFLVESFSLSDLAAGVFTNKSYVSKAINSSSELNFRRFVNRYRVAYAQEIFRKNMSLRVQDLTMLSGCHSVQTFCAIFKLFTGETPRDWCARIRKETP